MPLEYVLLTVVTINHATPLKVLDTIVSETKSKVTTAAKEAIKEAAKEEYGDEKGEKR
jgi:hypothetical protein